MRTGEGKGSPGEGLRLGVTRRAFCRGMAAMAGGWFLACAGIRAARGEEENPLAIGQVPPNVSLPDLKGFPLAIPGDLRGKVAVVHFWTDWCSYCLVEMPALDTLYRKHRRDGLAVVGVNVGQEKRIVRAFADHLNLSYPIVLDGDMAVASRYGVVGVPRTFFLDRGGVIRFRILGDATEAMLAKLIERML